MKHRIKNNTILPIVLVLFICGITLVPLVFYIIHKAIVLLKYNGYEY